MYVCTYVYVMTTSIQGSSYVRRFPPNHFWKLRYFMSQNEIMEWFSTQGANIAACNAFMSASVEVQSRVMDEGELGGREEDASARLVSRIQKAKQDLSTEKRKPVFLCLLRGIAARATGDNGDLRMTENLTQLIDICASIQKNLIMPQIRLGRQMVVYADITLQEETKSAVRDIMVKSFAPRLRPDAIHGDHKPANYCQKASFLTSLRNGKLWYTANKEATLGPYSGVFVVRLDVLLKKEVCTSWPIDKVCFFWNTTAMQGNKQCACDVLFYIPGEKVDDIREICEDPKYRNMEKSLHFLSIDPRCQSWFQYNCNHPSNTLKNGNPLFTVPSRCIEGKQEPGKFGELDLLGSPDYPERKRVFAEMSSDERFDGLCSHLLKLILVTSGFVPYEYLFASVSAYVSTLVRDPQTRAFVLTYVRIRTYVRTYSIRMKTKPVRNMLFARGWLGTFILSFLGFL